MALRSLLVLPLLAFTLAACGGEEPVKYNRAEAPGRAAVEVFEKQSYEVICTQQEVPDAEVLAGREQKPPSPYYNAYLKGPKGKPGELKRILKKSGFEIEDELKSDPGVEMYYVTSKDLEERSAYLHVFMEPGQIFHYCDSEDGTTMKLPSDEMGIALTVIWDG